MRSANIISITVTAAPHRHPMSRLCKFADGKPRRGVHCSSSWDCCDSLYRHAPMDPQIGSPEMGLAALDVMGAQNGTPRKHRNVTWLFDLRCQVSVTSKLKMLLSGCLVVLVGRWPQASPNSWEGQPFGSEGIDLVISRSHIQTCSASQLGTLVKARCASFLRTAYNPTFGARTGAIPAFHGYSVKYSPKGIDLYMSKFVNLEWLELEPVSFQRYRNWGCGHERARGKGDSVSNSHIVRNVSFLGQRRRTQRRRWPFVSAW
jgi:hypothetical protein